LCAFSPNAATAVAIGICYVSAKVMIEASTGTRTKLARGGEEIESIVD
jgi:hypothetical protein